MVLALALGSSLSCTHQPKTNRNALTGSCFLVLPEFCLLCCCLETARRQLSSSQLFLFRDRSFPVLKKNNTYRNVLSILVLPSCQPHGLERADPVSRKMPYVRQVLNENTYPVEFLLWTYYQFFLGNICWHFPCAKYCLKALYIYLVLITSLWGRFHHCPCLRDEKTGVEEVKWLVQGHAAGKTQSWVWTTFSTAYKAGNLRQVLEP